jgi:hypothetical protein
MISDDLWAHFVAALDHLRDNNRQLSFWMRDDDAERPTNALERLLQLCHAHDVFLALAIIPEPATTELARLVEHQTLILPCQHGYAHRNHAPAGERPQELGCRPIPVICNELSEGRRKMQQLFGDRLSDVLVPPWNRYDRAIVPHLPALGFQAISGFGRTNRSSDPRIAILDTHVDIIDWRGGRQTKPLADLIDILKAEVTQAIETNRQVGFLTHHLCHDAASWAFLEGLLAYTRSHPAIRWTNPNDFLGEAAGQIGSSASESGIGRC